MMQKVTRSSLWNGSALYRKVQIKVMTKNDGTRSTDYCYISQPSSTHWFQVQTQSLPEVPSTLGRAKEKRDTAKDHCIQQ